MVVNLLVNLLVISLLTFVFIYLQKIIIWTDIFVSDL